MDDDAGAVSTKPSFPVDLAALTKEDIQDAHLLWEEIKAEPDYQTLLKGIQGTRKPPTSVAVQREYLLKFSDRSASGIFSGDYLTLYRILLDSIKKRAEPVSQRRTNWNAKFAAETLCTLFIMHRKWKKDDLSKRKIPTGTRGSAVVYMNQLYLLMAKKLEDIAIDEQNKANKTNRLSLHIKRTVRLQDTVRFERQLALPDRCPSCGHTSLMLMESREFIEGENERRRNEYDRKMNIYREQTSGGTNTTGVTQPRRSPPYAPRVACFCCKLNCHSQADGSGCDRCVSMVEVDGLGGHLKVIPGTLSKVCTCEICTCSCEIDYSQNQRYKVAKVLAGRNAKGKFEENVPKNSLTEFGNILIDHLANGAAKAGKDSTKNHQDAYEKAALSMLQDERLKHNAPLRSIIQNRFVRPDPATIPDFSTIEEENYLGSANAPIELDLTQDTNVARMPLRVDSDSDDETVYNVRRRKSRHERNNSGSALFGRIQSVENEDAKPAALTPKDFRFYQNRLSREKIDVNKTLRSDLFTKQLLEQHAKNNGRGTRKLAPITPSPKKKSNTGVNFALDRIREMHAKAKMKHQTIPTNPTNMRYRSQAATRKLSEFRFKKIFQWTRSYLSIMTVVARSNGAPQYVIKDYRRVVILNYFFKTKNYELPLLESIIEGTKMGMDIEAIIDKIWKEFQLFFFRKWT